MLVTNRSYDRAVELARELNGEALRFDDWEGALSRVDVVISSTGAPFAVIRPEHIEKVRRKRKFAPLFIIDIAVPRDVEHEVGDIEEVYLYDLDTLQKIADKARARRENEIQSCREMISREVEKWRGF